MIKRTLNYSVSVIVVAEAVLLQPICPAFTFKACGAFPSMTLMTRGLG